MKNLIYAGGLNFLLLISGSALAGENNWDCKCQFEIFKTGGGERSREVLTDKGQVDITTKDQGCDVCRNRCKAEFVDSGDTLERDSAGVCHNSHQKTNKFKKGEIFINSRVAYQGKTDLPCQSYKTKYKCEGGSVDIETNVKNK